MPNDIDWIGLQSDINDSLDTLEGKLVDKNLFAAIREMVNGCLAVYVDRRFISSFHLDIAKHADKIEIELYRDLESVMKWELSCLA